MPIPSLQARLSRPRTAMRKHADREASQMASGPVQIKANASGVSCGAGLQPAADFRRPRYGPATEGSGFNQRKP
jgi:hypothetical protein